MDQLQCLGEEFDLADAADTILHIEAGVDARGAKQVVLDAVGAGLKVGISSEALQAAAGFFGQAVRADPNFRQARQGFQSASAGATSQSGGSVTTAATTPPAAAPSAGTDAPLGAPLSATVIDVGAVQSDVSIQTAAPSPASTSTGTTTSASQPPSTITVVGPPPTVAGVVRIFFILP